MVTASPTSTIEDMSRFGNDPAEFVRWKISVEIVILESGDRIWSEIDENVDTPTVPQTRIRKTSPRPMADYTAFYIS